MGGWDTVLGGAGVRGMLEGNPPDMVTVPSWKWNIVRVITRGVKCGQRTVRWLVKT